MNLSLSTQKYPFHIISAGLILFSGVANGKQNKVERPTRPNVVFIICDDLNDYSGAFAGHKQVKTPNIDKLAKSGVTFLNAHSNCPMSSPSRNSLFTGVYPCHSEDFGWTPNFEQRVLKNNKTLFEYFGENGYHTMGSGKLLHENRREY